jgi:hypothetical protein
VNCGSNALVVAAGNSYYYDFLAYDEANKHWNMSENSYSNQYQPAANYFATPFYNLYFANDSNGQGYIAIHQYRSGSAANTDLDGELVFSAATTATRTMAGTYTNHPECVARSQFDAGTANRHWISYSGNSFTVNFATPVSGTVSYTCAARN